MTTTQSNTVQIIQNGATLNAAKADVLGQPVVVTGRRLKMAAIEDEIWLEGELIKDPAAFVSALKASGLKFDWFTFAQKFTDIKPHYRYHYDWDNMAAIPLNGWEEWWEKRVSHDLRKDVKRSEKRGLVVKSAPFDDDFVRGISGIYNEARVRQGRHFWHYGKDFAAVKAENSTFIERSEFVGAYVESELVGFIKLVYTDGAARMMQILSKEAHQDKRPTNALIAKAVEIACERGCTYLTYGKYTYDNKKNSSIVQFKRRNGFEEILFPRYAIPFTAKGKAAIAAGLHLGIKRLIPEWLMYRLLDARAKVRAWRNPEAAPARVADAGEPEAAVSNE